MEGDVSRDREPARAAGERAFDRASVTFALFALNVGVFAGQVVVAGGLRSALGVPPHVLRWLGANASLFTIADSRFETLVTSCFLHASALHLALNLLPLYQVGRLLERAVGSARFGALYLASGIVGSAVSAIWGRFFEQTLSVGASGAICGLIGAAIVVGLRTEGVKSELSARMALWLVLLLLVGVAKYLRGDYVQVDNAAHVGGALGGAVVAASFRHAQRPSDRAERLILAGCALVVAVSAAVVFVRDRTDPFLFMDRDERMKSALESYRAGRCAQALTAMRRALAMDPRNGAVIALHDEIARECRHASPRP